MIRFHAERCKFADLKAGDLFAPWQLEAAIEGGREWSKTAVLVYLRTGEESDGSIDLEDVWRIVASDDSETDPAEAP